MRFCENEDVDVYEATGPDLARLLLDASAVVDAHEGTARVITEPQVDPDNGDFTYVVTVYLHD